MGQTQAIQGSLNLIGSGRGQNVRIRPGARSIRTEPRYETPTAASGRESDITSCLFASFDRSAGAVVKKSAHLEAYKRNPLTGLSFPSRAELEINSLSLAGLRGATVEGHPRVTVIPT